jgi:hypothetical protein
MPEQIDSALAAVIDAHQEAVAAVTADAHDDVPAALLAAEDAALDAIAALPCNDAQFLEKLRYMIADHCRLFGEGHESERADQIIRALKLHFDRPATMEHRRPAAPGDLFAAPHGDIGDELAKLRARATLLETTLVEINGETLGRVHDALNQQASDVASGLDDGEAQRPAEDREEILNAYDEWLFYERRMLHVERFGREAAKRRSGEAERGLRHRQQGS